MTLDAEDIEAIATAVARKLSAQSSITDDVEYMAMMIRSGRGDEIRAMQRKKLFAEKGK